MADSTTNIWIKLARSLKGLLGDDGAGAKAPAAGQPRPQAGEDRALHTVASQLEQMLARDPGLKAKLQIISLAEFHDWAGDKWPRLAAKVAMIVDQVIRHHLGRDNPFCQETEDSWVLAFPKLEGDAARQRTLVIVEELGRRLFGDVAPGAQRPMAVAAEVLVADAVSGEGALDLRMVRSAIEESRAFVPATVADSSNRWQSMGVAGLSAKEEAVWEVMEPTSGGGLRPPAFDPDMIGALPPGASLSLLWRPTWVASGEAISAYGARILRRDRDGADAMEGCRAYPPGDLKTALELDRFVVATAVRDIIAQSRQPASAGAAQPSVIVPLSWTSLASDQRGQVVVPFSDLAQDTRNSRLVVEIFGIPDGTTTPELEAVVSFVRSLCKAVLVRTRISARRSSLAAEIGVAMVGLDLSELRPDQRMEDDDLLAALHSVQEASVKDGIGCYLWSARHRRVVGDLVNTGFDMVNGPGLMKDIGRPAIVVPAPRTRFLAA
jgi:hypothetical protein